MKLVLLQMGDSHMFMTFLRSYKLLEIERLLQERLRLLQVSSIKALREPAIDRCQEVSAFGALVLLLPQACQAHGGPQLPGFGLLLAGNGPRLLEAGFRLLPWGPWALPQEQRAPERGLLRNSSGDAVHCIRETACSRAWRLSFASTSARARGTVCYTRRHRCHSRGPDL